MTRSDRVYILRLKRIHNATLCTKSSSQENNGSVCSSTGTDGVNTTRMLWHTFGVDESNQVLYRRFEMGLALPIQHLQHIPLYT